MITRAHNWSLSCVSQPHLPILFLKYILINIILPSMPRFYKLFLPFRFFDQNFVRISHLPHACYMPHPFHSPWFITLIILLLKRSVKFTLFWTVRCVLDWIYIYWNCWNVKTLKLYPIIQRVNLSHCNNGMKKWNQSLNLNRHLTLVR